MVICRHLLGDPSSLQSKTLLRIIQRAGDRELQSLVSKRRQAAISTSASHLPEGNLRPHVGMLENARERSASLFRNSFVFTEEKLGLRGCSVIFPVTTNFTFYFHVFSSRIFVSLNLLFCAQQYSKFLSILISMIVYNEPTRSTFFNS